MKKKKFPINSKKSSILAQFNSIGRASTEGRSKDRCSGETKTPAIISYPFTRNLSPFHTERAFTVKPQQTLFPSDNTIDVSKTAPFKELFQHMFNFRYLHDFALCSSAIHFYTRIMLSLPLPFSPPAGKKQEDETSVVSSNTSCARVSRDHVMCRQYVFDAWKIIKDAPLPRFITFEIYSLFLSSLLVFFLRKEYT